ncbi:MAG TPA: hypothetical protein VML55_21435 [Planctomycetaceae bacterium]|nr:hypothetical protein [Planctomycetaceae bacterium]
MTRTIHFAALAGATGAAFCLATLSPAASNTAAAQIVFRSGQTHGGTQAYYHGYGTGYNARFGTGHNARFGNRYGYGTGFNSGFAQRSSMYGSRYGYTGYGGGPYGYGSSSLFVSPSLGGYGYRSGGTYRSIYNPNTATYYSPYGYWGY